MRILTLMALAVFTGAGLHAGLFNTNLIVNSDAESGSGSVTGNDVFAVPGWTTANGFTVTQYGSASEVPTNIPGPAVRGTNLFTGGPLAAVSSASQLIDLSAAASLVDASAVSAGLAGWLGGWSSQDDNAVLKADFLDGGANVLASMSIGPVLAADRTNQTALLFRGITNTVPAATRQVKITLTMTRLAGSYNDGYADTLSFVLTTPQPALAIQKGAGLTVSWPLAAAGWQLQSATNLSGTPLWMNVAPPYQTNATQIQLASPAPTSPRFYRLALP
jgi:hypothetical protein